MFSDRVLAQYLSRSYHAVDGLWFVKVEERLGFDAALEIDGEVWGILAKIQAREARKALAANGNSPEELQRCFALKLTADGHQFTSRLEGEDVVFEITRCEWLELLRKSGREELAAKVAERVCPTEGWAWCREFGEKYEFAMPCVMCLGGGPCVMRFVRK